MRVHWYIGAALIAVVICSLTVSIAVISTTGHQSAMNATDEVVEAIGTRTTERVAADLTEAIATLEMLHGLLDDERLTVPAPVLERTMAVQLDAAPSLSGLFVGYPDGGFVFVRRDDRGLVLKHVAVEPTRRVTEVVLDDEMAVARDLPNDVYDPRVRPWYVSAAAADRIVWTDPYVFFSSGDPGVTAAIAIRDRAGDVTAVVGADVSLASLSSALDVLPVAPDGEAFLVADELVIAAPSGYDTTRTRANGEIELATVDQIGDDVVEALAAGTRHTAGDGSRVRSFPLDDDTLPAWEVVVRTDRIEFVESLRRQSRLALTATALSALLLLGVIGIFVNWLRRPIDELDRRARFDSLTRLLNRQALLDDGAELVRAARAQRKDVVVAVLDIDDFKSVNDGYGHSAGDDALRRLAAGLQLVIRPTDLVGRLGGDEFVVVLPGLGRDFGDLFLSRLHDVVTAELRAGTVTGESTITIGATSLEGRPLDLEALIEEADAQLIAAKRAGKRAGKGSVNWAADEREHTATVGASV